MHTIFACEEAARAWFQSPLALRNSNIEEKEIASWLREFIKREDMEVVETLTIIAHGMWLARNKLAFEGKYTDSSLVISRGLSTLHTYQQANKHPSKIGSNSSARLPTVCRWMPLQEGEYKLNIDAAEGEDLR